MFSLIPLPYRLLLLLFWVAGAGWVGYHLGAKTVKSQWDQAKQAQVLTVREAQAKQAEATVQVVTQYVDRIKTVRERGAKIIKEVPTYVPSNKCFSRLPLPPRIEDRLSRSPLPPLGEGWDEGLLAGEGWDEGLLAGEGWDEGLLAGEGCCNCDLPGSFRVWHDAAARGEPADPAGIADAPAVAAPDLAVTLATNYTACQQNAEQLIGLQTWVNEVRK